MPGYPLLAACEVKRLLGLPIAVGLAVLAEYPDEPFAHAFNVQGNNAVDLALAEHETVAYWGYLPSPGQLAVDRLLLALEAPSPSVFRQLPATTANRVATCP